MKAICIKEYKGYAQTTFNQLRIYEVIEQNIMDSAVKIKINKKNLLGQYHYWMCEENFYNHFQILNETRGPAGRGG